MILVGAGHNLRKLLAWLRAQTSYALLRERLNALITLIERWLSPVTAADHRFGNALTP